MSAPDFGQLMRLGWGFRETKLFLVANDWDLFSLVAETPKTKEELASTLNVNTRALGMMLDGLTAMTLLTKNQDRYSNGEAAQAYLVKNTPTYRGDIFKHLHQCWSRWNFLEDVIKTGHKSEMVETPFGQERDFNRPYIWGMDNVGQERAQKILTEIDLSNVNNMLDLACGAATYSIAFAKKNPNMHVTAFDLPLTLEVSKENIAKNNLTNRYDFIEGSFWEKDLGSGYDLAWLSQIVHCFNNEDCQKLVQKTVDSLASGGRLMIHDFLMEEDRTSPDYAALFSVHMLVVTDGGQAYTINEAKNWLVNSGLKDIEYIEVDAWSRLVVGVKE